MPTLGTTELIIILVIVLLLFGGSRIGELGGALGRGIREFKTSVRDDESPEDEKAVPPARTSGNAATNDAPAPRTAATPATSAASTTASPAAGSAAAAGAPPAGASSTGAATVGMTDVGATTAGAPEGAPRATGDGARRDS